MQIMGYILARIFSNMASQRDGRQSFSCRRFDDLFAASPRAKEIFASFYGKSGNRASEPREGYTKQGENSGLPIPSLQKSFDNKRTIDQIFDQIDVLKTLNSRCKPGKDIERENFPSHEKDHNSDRTLNETTPDTPTGNVLPDINLQENTDSPLGNDISFLESIQGDEPNDGMESFNKQVIVVLKNLEEAEKRITEEKCSNDRKKQEQVLCEWSLRNVETNNEKEIIVEGHRSGDPEKQNWRSTVICKRVSARSVKTKSGSLYNLSGSIDAASMAENGFPIWLTKAFKNGFPSNWKRLLQQHYKENKQRLQNECSTVDSNESIQNTVNKKKNEKLDVKEKTREVRPRRKEPDRSIQKDKAKIVKISKTPNHLQTRTCKTSVLRTPPTSVLPKEQEVKTSRSGRIIAPPLEYWRGQRMIAKTHDDSISIVKCHLEEHSVQLLVAKPLSRKVLDLKTLRSKKGPVKGTRQKSTRGETTGEETTTADNVTSDTDFTISTNTGFTTDTELTTDTEFTTAEGTTSDAKVTTDTTESDSVPSSFVKTLTYTTSDTATNDSNHKLTGGARKKSKRFVERSLLVSQPLENVADKDTGDKVAVPGDGIETDDNHNFIKSGDNKTKMTLSKTRQQNHRHDVKANMTKSESSVSTRSVVSRKGRRTSNSVCDETSEPRSLKDVKPLDAGKKDTILRNKTAMNDAGEKYSEKFKNKATLSGVTVFDVDSSNSEERRKSLRRKNAIKSEVQLSDFERGRRNLKRQTKNMELESSDAEAGQTAIRESGKRVTRNATNELESLYSQSKTARSFKRQKVTKDQINQSSDDECILQHAVNNHVGKNLPNNNKYMLSTVVEGRNSGESAGRTHLLEPDPIQSTQRSFDAVTSPKAMENEKHSYPLRSRIQHKYLVNNGNTTMNKIECLISQKDGSIVQRNEFKLNRQPRNSSKPKLKSGKVWHAGKKNAAQHIAQLTDEEIWTGDEQERLIQAVSQVPPATAMFWQKVALLVKTRSAEECQLHIQVEKTFKNQKKKVPQKIEKKVVAEKLTARVGTLARTRQLKDILELQDDGYEDDIFDSTPFRSRGIVKFSPVDEDEFPSEELDSDNAGYKTPCSRTPMNRLRPAGPLTASGKSESDYISPGQLLRSVNRNEVDRYVHQLKKRKRGRKFKPAKSHTPVSKKTCVPHPLSFNHPDNCFNVREAPSDNEEEDYYWSDD